MFPIRHGDLLLLARVLHEVIVVGHGCGAADMLGMRRDGVCWILRALSAARLGLGAEGVYGWCRDMELPLLSIVCLGEAVVPADKPHSTRG
jgi:hypothetical protein